MMAYVEHTLDIVRELYPDDEKGALRQVKRSLSTSGEMMHIVRSLKLRC